ncbi:hypothetical protein CNY89_05195 [Amaricoccus sp. HAR-UPW-R2A-40]|nr:hypothetical protein CNY89_05195 [Amaricoccus sp. HAR-UPW-R2A-40]
MQNVDKICVNNMGGYVFNFSVQWLGADGVWHTSSWNSGNYPIDQSATSPELGSIGVPSDAIAVAPYGHAILGTSGQGHALVAYKQGANAVGTYNATGTTFINFDISLVN